MLNSELVEEHHLTRGICNWLPYSVAVDSSTNVYVSNHFTSELHKFKMEGTSFNLKKSTGSAFATYLPGRERKRIMVWESAKTTSCMYAMAESTGLKCSVLN